MEIIITDFGVSLGKQSERVVVRRNGTVIEEHPLFQVSHILIGSRGVSLSSDLVRECAAAGVPISFVSGSGQPLARLSSPEMTGSVETRRQQMLAFYDERGLHFAVAIAQAKLANQAVILKYFGKSRKEAQPAAYEQLRAAVRRIERTAAEFEPLVAAQAATAGAELTVDALRFQLLSIEGRAGRLYWEALRDLLPPELGFTGREHQGARDLTNSLLNYGYGILYSQVWGAAVLAGLDPFAGFLHVDRPGKPSLVLDLVEEFRQLIVDRTVFALLIKGVTYQQSEDGRLSDEARREFARHILDRLDATVKYEGKHERLRTVIQRQARHLACYFRREREYEGFVGTW